MALPEFAIIAALPVKTVRTKEGGVDILAYDEASGDFVRATQWLARLAFPDTEVDSLPKRGVRPAPCEEARGAASASQE